MRRDYSLYRKLEEDLYDSLRISNTGLERSQTNCIIFTELQLLFLKRLGLDNPFLAWALIDGHHRILQRPSGINWSIGELRQIHNMRLWLKEPSRFDMESAVESYERLPPEFCMFQILRSSPHRRDVTFKRRETLPYGLEEREGRLVALLEQPPQVIPSPIKYAPAGDYAINIRSESGQGFGEYTVHMTEKFASHAPGFNTSMPTPHRFRPPNQAPIPIEFTWDEVLATAKWMDEQDLSTDEKGNWHHRLASKELLSAMNAFTQFQKLEPNTQFKLKDIDHLVGMVNSGKSTLLMVLLVLFRRKYKGAFHATIILSEVADILEKMRMLSKYGIKAVPFIGDTTKAKHLAQLHANVARESYKSHNDGSTIPFGYVPANPHHGFQYLFNSCLLGGYVQDKNFPLRLGTFPCRRLKKTSGPRISAEDPEEEDRHNYWCPFILQCPVHTAQLEAVDADIWLTTPHGLIFISLLPQLVRLQSKDKQGAFKDTVGFDMKLFEAVCRRSDLIVYDEADRAQVTLDDIFAPIDKMVAHGEGFLDTLDIFDSRFQSITDRSRQWNPREQSFSDSRDERTIQWFNATSIAIQVSNRLMTRLYNNVETRRIVGEDVFNGLSVANKIASLFLTDDNTHVKEELEEAAKPHKETTKERQARDILFEIYNQFREDPIFAGRRRNILQGGPVLPRNTSLIFYGLDDEIFNYMENATKVDLFPEIYQVMDPEKQVQFVKALILLIWVSILEYATSGVLAGWQEVKNVIGDAPPPSVASWFERLNDYTGIVPLPPIGVMIGFRYTYDPASGGAQLEHIRYKGLGRWILYNARDAFAHENVIGPATFLMSATSFAPGSSKYHVQSPVTCVLKVHDKEIAEIKKTAQTVLLFRKGEPGGRRYLKVSGAGDEEARERNYCDLIKALVRVRSPSLGSADASIDSELERSFRDPNRRHALLICNSYKQVNLGLQSIKESRGKDFARKAWGIIRPGEPDFTEYGQVIERGSVELYDYLAHDAISLLAPMMSIERGHNILNRDNIAAFSSVFFLIRPMPVPDDIMPTITKLNFLSSLDWAPSSKFGGLGLAASQEMAEELNIRPISGGLDPSAWNNYDRAANFRNEMFHLWKRLIRGWPRFQDLPTFERDDLAWTDLILFVQTAGRCVRGNQAVNIYYCDGAFFPGYCQETPIPDTPSTSLLLAIKKILLEKLARSKDPNVSTTPEQEELTRILYQWFFESFEVALQPFEKIE